MPVNQTWIDDADGALVDPLATWRAFARQYDRDTLIAKLRAEATRKDVERAWYVLRHGRSDGESLAREMVAEGFEAFSPVHKQKQKVGRHRAPKIVQRDVMPGYLFVCLPLTHTAWVAVTTFAGVHGLLGLGLSPNRLHLQDVQRFQAESAVVERASPLLFGRNDEVRIISGPLASHAGKISRSEDKHGFAKVHVNAFGREATIELHVDMLDHV